MLFGAPAATSFVRCDKYPLFKLTIVLSLQGASTFDKDYMFFLVVTVLCTLFWIVAYMGRDSLYRWMAKHSKGRVCDTVSK